MGIRITTTGIRSLVESAASDKLYRGEITFAQRDAVTNINGHSSQTARDYYVQRTLEADVARATEVFGGILPGSIFQPRAMNKHLDWGVNHPHYSKDLNAVDRVLFSPQELLYMKNCIETMDQTTPKFVARVLDRIQSDPSAHSIFHLKHVFNTDRLRSGFRSNFLYDKTTRMYKPTYKRACVTECINAMYSDEYTSQGSNEHTTMEFIDNIEVDYLNVYGDDSVDCNDMSICVDYNDSNHYNDDDDDDDDEYFGMPSSSSSSSSFHKSLK